MRSMAASAVRAMGTLFVMAACSSQLAERTGGTESALTTTYRASTDFSGTQGFRGWTYGYGSALAPTPMTWVVDATQTDGGFWRGNETYALLAAGAGHPGAAVDVVRRWSAPGVGTVSITGVASDQNPACGDGVNVSILKDGMVLWQDTVLNGDAVGRSFALRASVVPATALAFVINRRGDNSCDGTNFDPSIAFTPSTNMVTTLASTAFSSVQGAGGFYYGTNAGGGWHPMTWVADAASAGGGYWIGQEQYELVYQSGAHPGQGGDSIRRWVAPSEGQVRVTGSAFDQNPGCGDGVLASIQKDGAMLWSLSIANGNTVGSSFDVTTTVHGGSLLDFVVNHGVGDNMCDSTGFNPTVAFTSARLPLANFAVRVGRPTMVRGPETNAFDAPVTVMPLSTGGVRVFRAGQNNTDPAHVPPGMFTFRMDAATPQAIKPVAPTMVLSPGAPGAFNQNGSWLEDMEYTGSRWVGLVHAEVDPYGCGLTRKSMAVASTSNEGATLTMGGQIITDSDPMPPMRSAGCKNLELGGAGDCRSVRMSDGYLYLYCLRRPLTPVGWSMLAARAPASTPDPGVWRKWYAGGWGEPGLGGLATPLVDTRRPVLIGTVSAYPAFDAVVMTNQDNYARATRPTTALWLAFSQDRTTFTTLADPLLIADDSNAAGPAELIGYPGVVAKDGTDHWTSGFSLFYTYTPPHNNPADGLVQYLASRDVSVTLADTSQLPVVGLEIGRSTNVSNGRWSTTAMVPDSFFLGSTTQSYRKLGYVLTTPPAQASTMLEECASVGDAMTWPGPGLTDRTVNPDGWCTPSTRHRTVGWIYQSPVAGIATLPLYRCFDGGVRTHFLSNDPSCEGLIAPADQQYTILLGYVLAQ